MRGMVGGLGNGIKRLSSSLFLGRMKGRGKEKMGGVGSDAPL